MNKMVNVFLIIICLFVTSNVYAASDYFSCTYKQSNNDGKPNYTYVITVKDDFSATGKFTSGLEDNFAEDNIGNRFHYDSSNEEAVMDLFKTNKTKSCPNLYVCQYFTGNSTSDFFLVKF